MADYKSAYTGAQIDGAVAGVTTNANNITALTTRVSTLEGKVLSVTGANSGIVTKVGNLIIQTKDEVLTWRSVITRNFPQAFPNACLFVGAQGIQCGDSGSDGYWEATSIQTKIVSSSQYRVFFNSGATNSNIVVRIIAIGY